MEWLNTHFIEPSTEEGDLLSGLEHPWENENFWPYLIRFAYRSCHFHHADISRVVLRGLSGAAMFFFSVLSQHHPSEALRLLSQEIIPLLTGQPRISDFSTEKDFVYASRRWKDRVKALRVELDRIPEDSRHDEYDNWWDRLSDIIGILEGRQTVILKVCEDLGADWREVCAASSVFVNTRLRRQDLV